MKNIAFSADDRLIEAAHERGKRATFSRSDIGTAMANHAKSGTLPAWSECSIQL